MERILVVEDSRLYSKLLQMALETKGGFQVVSANSYKEASELLERDTEFSLALTDLNLPDAPDGEVVDLLKRKNFPIVVFTSLLDDDVRDRILAKGVSEYVLKHGQRELDYVVEIINRLSLNKKSNILVLDDSSVSRKEISKILLNQNFNVIEQSDPKEALSYLKGNRNVDLLIVDEIMPSMSGVEFIMEVRKLYPKGAMGIVGISAYGSGYLSAKMLKAGADDFVSKPFIFEEFVCRINNTMDMLRNLRALKEASFKDFLTGLYNRKYFFEILPGYLANVERGLFSIAIGMLDIDDFKKVNDTYGHDVGDLVLVQLARELPKRLRKGDLVFRFGGEEIVLVAINVLERDVLSFFDRLRACVSMIEFGTKKGKFNVTVSIGVSFLERYQNRSIEEMLKEADEKMYQAKKEGKNRVVF